MTKRSALLTLIVSLFLVGLFTHQYYQAARILGVNIDASSLVGYWKFDEEGYGALDSSVGNNHGSLENGAIHTPDSHEGSGLLLGGGDDRVTLPTSGGINNLESFSLTVWVYPLEGGTIVHKGSSSPARFDLGINSAGFVLFRSGYSVQPGVWLAGESLPFNKWSHLAVTYSFSSISNTPILYINGTKRLLANHQTPIGVATADTSYLYFGNNHDLINRTEDPGINNAFTGKIDSISIHNRELSASEIASIYGLSSPTPSPKSIATPIPAAVISPIPSSTPSPSPTTQLTPTMPIPNELGTNSSTNTNTVHPNPPNPGLFEIIKKFISSLFGN